LLFVEGQPRDSQLIALEKELRRGIRDAVTRSSRKPFRWGGLTGYEQLEALAQELRRAVWRVGLRADTGANCSAKWSGL
jgi:hypothetical protein